MEAAVTTAAMAAMFIAVVLAVHVAAKIWQHGLGNAWVKSVTRKGSYTASLAHFWAMWDKSAIESDPSTTSLEKARRGRNIWGRYHRRTGEMHPPKYKKQLYDKMIADRASAAARDSEIGRD